MLYNVIWGRGVVKNMTFSRYIIYGWPHMRLNKCHNICSDQSVHPLPAHKHEDSHATHQLHCQ